MIIIGLLLLLGAVGLSAAAIWANPGMFDGSVGAVELFGYSAELTVGEVFLAGAVLGVLALLGIVMLAKGAGRGARRRAATRRRLREQQHELQVREQELAELRRQEASAAADTTTYTATGDNTDTDDHTGDRADTHTDDTRVEAPVRRGRHHRRDDARRDGGDIDSREEVSANR